MHEPSTPREMTAVGRQSAMELSQPQSRATMLARGYQYGWCACMAQARNGDPLSAEAAEKAATVGFWTFVTETLQAMANAPNEIRLQSQT
jgi:hypothetical protein